jgi:hypothetical protein
MTEERGTDRAAAPGYSASPDAGGVSSGQTAPAAGDVVELLAAEHRTLHQVFEEVLDLVRGGDEHAVRLRWGGVVRELLEHEVAEERVALPAAADLTDGAVVEEIRRRSQALRERLRDHAAFTDEVAPDDVAAVIALATEHMRTVDTVVVPLLQVLAPDERRRLGAELRQVMG